MSVLAKTTSTNLLSFTRNCLASTSRLTPFRHYATEPPLPTPTASPDEPVFGITIEKKVDKAVIKRYRGPGFPFIPSLRHVVRVHHPHLWSGKPFRELTLPLRKSGGRNSTGRITARHIGGGHKRRLRTVDFYRLESGDHDVVRIEYDPGRSGHIALIRRRGSRTVSVDEGAVLAEKEEPNPRLREEVKGGWSYILAPDGLRAGDVVVSYRAGIPKGIVEGWHDNEASPEEETNPEAASSEDQSGGVSSRALGLLRTATLKPGNVLPLYLIPPGTVIHNLSLEARGRMQLCRSAGVAAQVVAHLGSQGQALGGTAVLGMGGGVDANGFTTKSNGTVLVKLRSGEVRRIQPGAVATIGSVSNKEHQQEQLGNAGRARHLGRRPKVRGVAMNAVDHPHGGGRGKSKGNKQAHSVYGKLTKGVRTRRPKDKNGNKAVVTERPRGKQRK